jgi:hypothetical protein
LRKTSCHKDIDSCTHPKGVVQYFVKHLEVALELFGTKYIPEVLAIIKNLIQLKKDFQYATLLEPNKRTNFYLRQ